MLYPVILSGGYGGRLWPVSRVSQPKQFIPLVSDHSLLQETVLRIYNPENAAFHNMAQPTIVCNRNHRFMAAEQIRRLDIPTRQIILEPVGKNTAPAIAIAALDIQSGQYDKNQDNMLLVLPADHIILDISKFHQAIHQGMLLAQQNYLVTFGVIPGEPKTGYGYIETGETIPDFQNGFRVKSFTEKPDSNTAEGYLASGRHVWNSGIFLMKADVYLTELERYAPDIYHACVATWEKSHQDTDFCWLDEALFQACPSDSMDYAIMEKTRQAAVIPVDVGWSDVGSWSSLWEVVAKDSEGNVALGNIYKKDVYNSYIRSDKEIVAALGVQNLIIIDTADALLIAHRDREQDVKEVFYKLM